MLSRFFPDSVTEPVRVHVLAKRYPGAVDANHPDRLPPTSLRSLYEQGGLLTHEECCLFEASPRFEEAIRLRRWHDGVDGPERSQPDMAGLAVVRRVLRNVPVRTEV